MPILSAAVFDNTGHPYNVSRILTSDFLFDQKAYEEYSPVYLPITYVLSYGVQFAALTSLVTHTVCWYGKDILHQTRKAFEERRELPDLETYQPLRMGNGPPPARRSDDMSRASSHDPTRELPLGVEDVHCRLMRRYKDAPLTWYLIVLITMLAIATYTVEQYVFSFLLVLYTLIDADTQLKLPGPLALVWVIPSPCHHERVFHPGWHHYGCHQST
jgi:hypothetical protein